MTNFINIREALQTLETDPSAADERERKLIFDGEHLSANIAENIEWQGSSHPVSAR